MNGRKKTVAGRLWVRVIKGHKATLDITVLCNRDNPLVALREAMHDLDLGMPVWLPRHQADWRSFGLTRFLPEHFLETVDFDRMEISYIAPDDEKKPSRPFDAD